MDFAQAYWPHIEAARWFSGKSRGGVPRGHVVLGTYSQEPLVRSELVRVDYPDGGRENYHLLVGFSAEERPGSLAQTDLGWASDATDDPVAMGIVLRAIQSGTTSGELTCHSTGADRLDPELPPRRHKGEQSNTSVFFGDEAMLKVFRKLEPGRNLDVELHEALAHTGAVAELYGWIATPDHDLAMLVEALPQPVDGYALATQHVGDDFSSDAAALGVALAHVHRGLADALGTSSIDGGVLAGVLKARAESASQDAPQILDHLPGITTVFDTLSGRRLATQRVHGDFHLGQTLKTPEGWRIVDFEGEPMKSMDERRAMDSPWRDVAGLLRSIDYAAATRDDIDTTDWRQATRDAFLRAYCEAMNVSEDAALPAYELEKAVYEVVYEVRNRPHLVGVPLSFITTTLKES